MKNHEIEILAVRIDVKCWVLRHERRRIRPVSESVNLQFEASDVPGYITGVAVPIDGGELLMAGAEPGR